MQMLQLLWLPMKFWLKVPETTAQVTEAIEAAEFTEVRTHKKASL